jgi:hypothetical protein
MGKAKVSPTNGHTIPILELCAAVLSVETTDIMKQELNIDSKELLYAKPLQKICQSICGEFSIPEDEPKRRPAVPILVAISQVNLRPNLHVLEFVQS